MLSRTALVHPPSSSPPFQKSNFGRALALVAGVLHRSDVLGAMVLSAWATLLVSVTGTGGNFSKTGAEAGSRSPEADPDPTPGGPLADTGPLAGGVQLRSKTETQN